jgi:Tol biopolymer transport system component
MHHRQLFMAGFMFATLVLVSAVYLSPQQAFAATYNEGWTKVTGPYLGQEPPGMTVEMFAPDIVSTDQSEINSVFSPDMNEFYFTTWTRETGTKILVTSQIDGQWSAPQVASFSNHPSDVDPAISYDGKRLYFATRRPRPGESEARKEGFDLWSVERTESDWGEEQYLGQVLNSGKSQVYPTATRDGTLYFQAVREDGYGKADIYRENLGPAINSQNYEGDVFIAHDESYLIVSVYGRDDDLGGGDLYISFQGSGGKWSPLKNMGGAINSDKRDFCPMVTPDGKYLFFSSKREGEGDIFWVDAMVIETLRDP